MLGRKGKRGGGKGWGDEERKARDLERTSTCARERQIDIERETHTGKKKRPAGAALAAGAALSTAGEAASEVAVASLVGVASSAAGS